MSESFEFGGIWFSCGVYFLRFLRAVVNVRENWDFVKIVGQLKIPMGTFVGGKKK